MAGAKRPRGDLHARRRTGRGAEIDGSELHRRLVRKIHDFMAETEIKTSIAGEITLLVADSPLLIGKLILKPTWARRRSTCPWVLARAFSVATASKTDDANEPSLPAGLRPTSLSGKLGRSALSRFSASARPGSRSSSLERALPRSLRTI